MSISCGQRIEKSKAFPFGWKPIYEESKEITELVDFSEMPSIIFLPGDSRQGHRGMNGYSKLIEYLLKNTNIPPQKMPRIYSLLFDITTKYHRQYTFFSLKQFASGYKRLRTSPRTKAAINSLQSFLDMYILPIIQRKDGAFKSPKEIKRAFHNITFASHCHGSVFGYQIEKMLTLKLHAIYPNEVKELMGHLRMIHFASRRPLNNSGIYAKHVHIISQKDEQYADDFLTYNNLHKAIHRHPIQEKSALISLSDNEEILVLRECSLNPKIDEHNFTLSYFCEDNPTLTTKEDIPVIAFIRDIFRRFIFEPQDPDSLSQLIEKINPDFVLEQRAIGSKLMTTIQQERDNDLSLLTEWKNNPPQTYPDDAFFILQPDTTGKSLYEYRLEQYKKDGNNKPLITLFQAIDVNYWSNSIIEDGINIALNNRDFELATVYIQAKTVQFQMAQVEQSLTDIQPDDLPKALPLLEKLPFSSNDKVLYETLCHKSFAIQNSEELSAVQTYLVSLHEKIYGKANARLIQSKTTQQITPPQERIPER